MTSEVSPEIPFIVVCKISNKMEASINTILTDACHVATPIELL